MIAAAPMSGAMKAGVAILIAAFVGFGVLMLRTFDPNVAGSPFPPCMFHALTGLYCPGCGLTRALHALVHFDLGRALAMNALFVVSAPILLLLSLRSNGWLPRWTEAGLLPLTRPLFWLVLVVSFGVLRNLPWAPFSWLAPGGWPG